MANELTLGKSRHGDLIDFDADTPRVNVTLELTSQGISLVVPWSSKESAYASWFVDSSSTLDDSDVLTPVPKTLLFQDSYGSVLLVGCWARGYHMTLFGHGSGRVWASYAVLGVSENLDFRDVNGVQSEISGLRDWLGVTSLEEDLVPGRPHSFTLTAKSAPEIEIPGEPDLRIVPTWNIERTALGIGVRDRVICQTKSTHPTDWRELQQKHLALRDLLVLSQWRAEASIAESVMREDDLLTTLDGKVHGAHWRNVVLPSAETPPGPEGRRRHLIAFSHIGIDGVARWLSMRERFARALDPKFSLGT
jgi:hypothetical protein